MKLPQQHSRSGAVAQSVFGRMLAARRRRIKGWHGRFGLSAFLIGPVRQHMQWPDLWLADGPNGPWRARPAMLSWPQSFCTRRPPNDALKDAARHAAVHARDIRYGCVKHAGPAARPGAAIGCLPAA